MLYSLKEEAGHERQKGKSTNKNKHKKQRDNTHPLSPHPNPDMKQQVEAFELAVEIFVVAIVNFSVVFAFLI